MPKDAAEGDSRGGCSRRRDFGADPQSRDDDGRQLPGHLQRVPTSSGRLRAFVPVAEWSHRGQRRGIWGERIALAFLTSCGWAVEAHRFRFGRHDLDLIVRRGSVVAFVEVKTRRSTRCGAPIESLGWEKRRSIERTAEWWRLRHGRRGDQYRFDVVAVHLSATGGVRVEHFADAWRKAR